jgi:hypothetical protein
MTRVSLVTVVVLGLVAFVDAALLLGALLVPGAGVVAVLAALVLASILGYLVFLVRGAGG